MMGGENTRDALTSADDVVSIQVAGACDPRILLLCAEALTAGSQLQVLVYQPHHIMMDHACHYTAHWTIH